MALVVGKVMFNSICGSSVENAPTIALHDQRRVSSDRMPTVACLAPQPRRVKEHPAPRLLDSGFINDYPVVLRLEPFRPADMLNNKLARFVSRNHG